MILRRLAAVAGILIALVASYVLYQSGRSTTAMVQVIETRVAIPQDSVLTSAMLQWVQVPKDGVNIAAVQSPADLLGKVLTVPLPAGQQILPGWLTSTNSYLGSGFVSVPITTGPASAAAGTLEAGERVALMWIPGGLLNQPPTLEFLQSPLTILSVQDGQGNVISGPGVNPQQATGAPAIVDLRATQSEALTIESQENSGKLVVVGIPQGKEGTP